MNQNLPQRQPNSPEQIRQNSIKGKPHNTEPDNCFVCGKLVLTGQGYVLNNGVIHGTVNQCQNYDPYYDPNPSDEKYRQKAFEALDRFIVVCSDPRLLSEIKHYEDWLLKVNPVMISEVMMGAPGISWLYALPKINWKGNPDGKRFIGLLEKVKQAALAEYDPQDLDAWLTQKTDEIPTELQSE